MSVSSLSLSFVSTNILNQRDSSSSSSSLHSELVRFLPVTSWCPQKIQLLHKNDFLDWFSFHFLVQDYSFRIYVMCTNGLASSCKRRLALLGVGTLAATSLLPASSLLAEEVPKNYSAFVDRKDGYLYYYPSDWREFDFRAHDSAFKDRYLQLQNVRVRFIPTDKNDIHDLGSMEEVVYDLVNHVYAAPSQVASIYDMKEWTIDGRNYYTFEYGLMSKSYATISFATIAIANGRCYTLIVGANERRWKRVRNKLKVVADSFRVLEI